MNLLETLRADISSLKSGDYSEGLRAVLQHIEVAHRHLSRGQVEGDETAFTDAIYRTNQAFEGSLKEAYRVLASKDPKGRTSYQIENYLADEEVLKNRVLAQFQNYRQEWRNPSTHDHKLNFDQAEAFIAIVSVSAFVKLLVDQIAEAVAFNAVTSQVSDDKSPVDLDVDNVEFIEGLADLIAKSLNEDATVKLTLASSNTSSLVGAVGGALQASLPDSKVKLSENLKDSRLRGDIIIRGPQNQEILIEVKKFQPSEWWVDDAVDSVAHYLRVAGLKEGILLAYKAGEVHEEYSNYMTHDELHVKVICPPVPEVDFGFVDDLEPAAGG